MIVRVKFCGGCNPRYDRGALFRRLKAEFPETIFQTELASDAAAGIVICGCDSACAEQAGCIGAGGRLVIWKESAYESLCDFLRQLSTEKTF